MRKVFDRLRKIDSHVHLIDKRLQKKPTSKPFLEDTFDKQHGKDVVTSSKSRRVVKSIIFPLPSSNLSTKIANRMVLEASKDNKHLVPVAFIRERVSAKEISGYRRQGFKGFKVYSNISERLAKIFEKSKLPIILHPPFYPSTKEFHALINRVGGRLQLTKRHIILE